MVMRHHVYCNILLTIAATIILVAAICLLYLLVHAIRALAVGLVALFLVASGV